MTGFASSIAIDGVAGAVSDIDEETSLKSHKVVHPENCHVLCVGIVIKKITAYYTHKANGNFQVSRHLESSLSE